MSSGVIIFLLTYLGVALGSVPGLALDRTGFALLGALAMVLWRVETLETAFAAVHLPTILLLYGLMIVSAQLRLGGFYTEAARRIGRFTARPRFFLGALMLTAAALSALLANDIVCLAFTPVLCVALRRGGLRPAPQLIGLAAASNIGSAATIIGNPQNMLIGQLGGLDFGRFLAWCLPPTVISLAGAWLLLLALYRGRWRLEVTSAGASVAAPPDEPSWPEFQRWQSVKGLLAVAAVVGLFFTPIPREVSALAVAGVLLVSRRMHTRAVLGLVDWHLITLFCGLFMVIHGLELTGAPERALAALRGWGVDPAHPYWLTGAAALLSNLVSNVPATLLLVKFLNPATPEAWYVLALAATFAGNLITIGSIANLIVFEQARAHGVRIGFWEHARAGIPITAFSLLATLGWIALRGG